MPKKLLTAAIVASLLNTPIGIAQNSDEAQTLQQEIEALKQGQAKIHEDIKAIRHMLEQVMRPRQAAVPIEQVELLLSGLDDDQIKGNPDAKLMLIEFSDYQCPFCRRHFITTLPQLEREYVDSGHVKYVFRDFPIDSIHPHAFDAARAARCAGEQGEYWAMHERFFQNANALGLEQLPGHAETIGIDPIAFTECLNSERYFDEVRQDIADGNAAGVTGTPTFFVAVEGDEPGTAHALMKIRGAQPFAVFQGAIESALAKFDGTAEAN